MTDFYPAAVTADTALQGTVLCDSWFDSVEWGPSCAALAGRDPEVFATAASEVLYMATGYRWPGVCTSAVRPCAGLCGCWMGWVDSECVYCDECRLPCELVRLPSPVQSILSVTIDGAALDAAEYRVVNQEYLHRLEEAWPYQNLRLAPGEVGTWSVDLRHGAVPPPLGVLAARSLACWLAAADGSASCALPAHVQSLSRQGINQVFDPRVTGGLALGDVSLFLQSYAVGPADVWSPDLPQLPPEVI